MFHHFSNNYYILIVILYIRYIQIYVYIQIYSCMDHQHLGSSQDDVIETDKGDVWYPRGADFLPR